MDILIVIGFFVAVLPINPSAELTPELRAISVEDSGIFIFNSLFKFYNLRHHEQLIRNQDQGLLQFLSFFLSFPLHWTRHQFCSIWVYKSESDLIFENC
ncbi:unnamed protein product [Citrullus colocynthis]|uniref:Secreted protein n=1 Tax=Citrullus colocynthis TaxID=252529 RepID=A0ABP0YBM1_9ROSI